MFYTFWLKKNNMLTLQYEYLYLLADIMESLTLAQLRDALPARPVLSHGDDFFIMNLSFRPGQTPHLAFPCRFEGVICLYCIEGCFDLMVGRDSFAVTKDCFAISLPEDILSFKWLESREVGKITIMAISDRLLQEMEFDRVGALYAFRCRMVKVDTRTMILIHNFQNIFRSVTGDRHADVTRSLGYLLRSMNIELAHIWDRMADRETLSRHGNNPLTGRFLALLARWHTERRDLEFYAERLGLTPKYLSAAVKADTGRTAPEWIAEYVLMEARYYLKHTSLSVKEIAWELHFNNQMDFYRYFQRHAGHAPSEYRNQ